MMCVHCNCIVWTMMSFTARKKHLKQNIRDKVICSNKYVCFDYPGVPKDVEFKFSIVIKLTLFQE